MTLAALNLDSRLVRSPSAWQPGDDEGSWPRLDPSSPVTISVDGELLEFRSLGEGERWVAVGRAQQRIITLDARGIEPEFVSLRMVTDLEPYVAGARLRRERMSQAHEDH